MTEPKSKPESILCSPDAYLQRAEAFLAEVSGWCKGQGLVMRGGTVTLREEGMAEYEAPTLGISKEGITLAELVPAGSRFVDAQGGIDLVGLRRHPLLFCVGKSASSRQAISAGKAASLSSIPILSRVQEDGWYWIDSYVWQAKRVQESLFLSLLTDVSGYEF